MPKGKSYLVEFFGKFKIKEPLIPVISKTLKKLQFSWKNQSSYFGFFKSFEDCERADMPIIQHKSISLSSNTLPDLSQFFSILTDLKCYRSAFSSSTNHLWNAKPKEQQERKCVFSNCKTCFFFQFSSLWPLLLYQCINFLMFCSNFHLKLGLFLFQLIIQHYIYIYIYLYWSAAMGSNSFWNTHKFGVCA
jgi:hypothetical protein